MPEATDFSLRHIYVSPREPGSGPLPAVVLLHGLGANEYDLLPLAQHLPSAAHTIAARAPFDYYGGAAWYDLTDPRTLAPELETFEQSFATLQRFLGEVRERYAEGPLYMLGFSMGASMALASVLHDPGGFAGLIGLSGYLPPGFPAEARWGEMKGFPCFIGHGTRDPLVPIERGREVRDRLAGAGADLSYVEHPIEHGISDAMLRDVANWLRERIGP